MDKSPTTLTFRSIEPHFEIGRLQITIGVEDFVKKRVVGPEELFGGREENAIAFVLEQGEFVEVWKGRAYLSCGYITQYYITQRRRP
jgi:hypothetical protein